MVMVHSCSDNGCYEAIYIIIILTTKTHPVSKLSSGFYNSLPVPAHGHKYKAMLPFQSRSKMGTVCSVHPDRGQNILEQTAKVVKQKRTFCSEYINYISIALLPTIQAREILYNGHAWKWIHAWNDGKYVSQRL